MARILASMARSRIVNLANFEQFTAINILSDPGHIGGPVVIPSVAQVVLRWALTDGRPANNVLYGHYTSGFTPTTTIANNILTGLTTGALWTALAAFMPTTGGLTQVILRDVSVANQPQVPSTAAGQLGTSASPALPDETALVTTLRTAKSGPQNRGRMFTPNFATNSLGAAGVASAGLVTALQNWVNNFPTILSGQGLSLSIGQPARAAYTGSTGTQHPARAAQSTPVTVLTVRDNHWDTIRRRGLK